MEREVRYCRTADGATIAYSVTGRGSPIILVPSLRSFGHGDHSSLRTVLFTDLVGQTEMMSRLGDERGREVLRKDERITREVLKAARRHRGEDDGGWVHGVVWVGDEGGGVRGGVAESNRRAQSGRRGAAHGRSR